MLKNRELTIYDLHGLIKLLKQLWLDKNIDTDVSSVANQGHRQASKQKVFRV